jgi:mRNA interferase RelE/StbE
MAAADIWDAGTYFGCYAGCVISAHTPDYHDEEKTFRLLFHRWYFCDNGSWPVSSISKTVTTIDQLSYDCCHSGFTDLVSSEGNILKMENSAGYSGFDRAFFSLSKRTQDRIQASIDEMGTRLHRFAHHRLTGSDRFRLRVGDYRIIYTFSVTREEIHLLGVGHRREIYR